jgi:hypothetical protein
VDLSAPNIAYSVDFDHDLHEQRYQRSAHVDRHGGNRHRPAQADAAALPGSQNTTDVIDVIGCPDRSHPRRSSFLLTANEVGNLRLGSTLQIMLAVSLQLDSANEGSLRGHTLSTITRCGLPVQSPL